LNATGYKKEELVAFRKLVSVLEIPETLPLFFSFFSFCIKLAPLMSAMSTPGSSPGSAPIQPLHNPAQAAHVVVPQAPLGNVANQAPGLGAKALLAKKLAKSQ